MRADVCELSGGERDVHFGCVSGAKVTDFIRQAQVSAAYGVNFYDWVFVVGGWNSSDVWVFGISLSGVFFSKPSPTPFIDGAPNTSELDTDRSVIEDATREFIPYCADNLSK